MTNCGTLQSKFAATGDREVAATAFEAEMRAGCPAEDNATYCGFI